jgi:CheY-like chemotaxis protein
MTQVGPETPRKRILVIEDNEFNRDLLTQILEDSYVIMQALDGSEGLARAEQERPDLILMDFGMPKMDGWEATRRIKAQPDLRHIPIIAITSHAMVGDEQKAREAGCDDYMAKPIHEDELIEKIKRWIG